MRKRYELQKTIRKFIKGYIQICKNYIYMQMQMWPLLNVNMCILRLISANTDGKDELHVSPNIHQFSPAA